MILESGVYFIGMITNATKKPQSELLENYVYGSYNYSYTYSTYSDKQENLIPPTQERTKLDLIKENLIKNTKDIASKFLLWLDN